MSCQVNLTATITDIAAVRRCLFPTDDARGSDSWLQLCELSASPTGDLIALAHERRLVILSARWDSNSELSQFQILFSGSVHESDNIKAVICLPIVGQTKSSHVVPDWSCILLGFESGFLRFYTESCVLLLEEQLHNEVITNIKCRSQHNPRPDIAPDLHPEEIYIQYQSCVCFIPGSQLFPILRTYRSELARVQAMGAQPLEPAQGNLNPKKWGFQDQASINDIAVVGVNLHGTFDHLLTASTCGGFDAKYRSSAPYNNLVLAAGSRPFVGYHYALEGTPQPVLSDVAKAVASKLKSALPGWLTGSKVPVEKQMTVAMQPADSMGCRFGLCDLRRTGIGIVLSPDHKLAAVSDALGRVLLLDAFRGITLRIFKGYREAQCSFIQVPDERHSKHRIGNKVALFLVIYSPKRGTLEIFTVQQGTKIATFSASKFSRLVYNNYGLLGFATTSKSRYVCPCDTVLIDNDGQIKDISIPFHFALSEKNNKRARDIHLYKKLKQLLKSGECDMETLMADVGVICVELKTDEVKIQTLELLVGNKSVSADVMLKCVQTFLDDSEIEASELRIMSQNVFLLLSFFLFIKNDEVDVSNVNSEHDKLMDMDLGLEAKQLNNLQKLLDLITLRNQIQPMEMKVGFEDHKNFAVSQFISVFNTKEEGILHLNPNIDAAELFKISQAIFERYIISSLKNFDEFEQQVLLSKIATKDLFDLLIHYWVHRSFDNVNLENEMNNLFSLILHLVKTVDRNEIVTDFNDTSKFWSQVRDILGNSSRPFPALIAAILCKAVSEKVASATGENKDSEVDESIEMFSQEGVDWSLLIGKLEDVSLLDIILSYKPVTNCGVLPNLKHEKIDISLKMVLEKGRGAVSELVARWLTSCGMNPENLVINDRILKKPEDLDKSGSSGSDSVEDKLPEPDIMPQQLEEVQSDRVIDRLNLLKVQFPFSLEAGMVLANMSWEYAMAWLKDIQDLDKLDACVKCLNHIPSSHLREGLFPMIWNTHLKILFEACCKLINKVGRLPKERLCQQDTGLSDYQITKFFEICTHFLDTFMDAIQRNIGTPKPELEFEQIWENGPKPLVELALQQNEINYYLLQLHYQLSHSLEIITTFSIKHSKPLTTLFDSYMSSLFFSDFLREGVIDWDRNDTKVQASRTQFLFKAISASLESVTVSDGKTFSASHSKWMSKFCDLAQLWNLDADVLRRYEVIQAYTNGYDRLGDMVFSMVRERKKLGPELLKIAGKRLGQFLTVSPNICENTVALSTEVTRYIDQLDDDWCAPSSLEDLENVANRSLAYTDESLYEYKVADLMLDGCRSLRRIHEST